MADCERRLGFGVLLLFRDGDVQEGIDKGGRVGKKDSSAHASGFRFESYAGVMNHLRFATALQCEDKPFLGEL